MNLSRLPPTTMAVAIAAVVSVQTPTALAQGRSLLEEVVVTAQKREQNIQDVGISITAFSGEQLDALGFSKSSELAMMTPGVHVGGNPGGSKPAVHHTRCGAERFQ